MYTKPAITLLLLFILKSIAPLPAAAQGARSFDTTGNNVESYSCSEVLFNGTNAREGTSGRIRSNGAAWYHKELDLSKPFSMGFYILISNFGEPKNNSPLDGFSFVLQANGTRARGRQGSGMGFGNINPSVAIAFDTNKDSADADPAFEHVSIQANGQTAHNTSLNLSAPYNLTPFIREITGPFAPIRAFALQAYCKINWDPATQLLTVYLDNDLVAQTTYDIVGRIFGNNPMVTWGFTSSHTYTPESPAEEIRLPRIRFYFGYILPAYKTSTRLDTCYTDPIQFFDNSAYDENDIVNSRDVARYFWNFGNGNTSTEKNPPPQSYPGPGTYQLQFTVTNQIGCTVDTLKRTIRLGSKPKPDFTVTGLCQGNDTYLKGEATVAVGQPYRYSWYADGAPLAEGKEQQVLFNTAGTKKIALTVQSDLGCLSDAVEKTIVVQESPKADFTFTQDCFGNVSFQSNISNGVPGAIWQWQFGDGSSSLLQHPRHTFAVNDTFAASLTVSSTIGCRSATVTKPIAVYKVFANAGRDTILAQGQPLRLNAIASSNDIKWSPATNLSDPFHPTPTVTLQQDAAYILEVHNTNGCIAKDTISIKVFAGPQVYVPTAFTPNGDGLNDIVKPTIPGLYKMHNFTIYNRWGQKVFETADINTGWTGQQNGRVLPGEIYVWFVRITDYTGKQLLQKGTVLLVR